MECKVYIERKQNGYEVEIHDPKIVEQNRDPSSKRPWRDPKRSYVFKSVKEVLDFLNKNLDKALPMDEYSSSFDKAAGEIDGK